MSDLEQQCHIDKGTYTDGPVLTADVRKLFDRIAELQAERIHFEAVAMTAIEENDKLTEQEVELKAEVEILREALRRLYGCFAIDPFPLPKEVQRIVGEALKESSDESP